jgi:hypothetical protein
MNIYLNSGEGDISLLNARNLNIINVKLINGFLKTASPTNQQYYVIIPDLIQCDIINNTARSGVLPVHVGENQMRMEIIAKPRPLSSVYHYYVLGPAGTITGDTIGINLLFEYEYC